MRDHQSRSGRHVANHQGAVRLPPAVARLLHVAFVDMVRREIARDAGKAVDVILADGFGEACAVSDLDVKFGHRGTSERVCTLLSCSPRHRQRYMRFSRVTISIGMPVLTDELVRADRCLTVVSAMRAIS